MNKHVFTSYNQIPNTSEYFLPLFKHHSLVYTCFLIKRRDKNSRDTFQAQFLTEPALLRKRWLSGTTDQKRELPTAPAEEALCKRGLRHKRARERLSPVQTKYFQGILRTLNCQQGILCFFYLRILKVCLLLLLQGTAQHCFRQTSTVKARR